MTTNHSGLRRSLFAAFIGLSLAACQSPSAGNPEWGENYAPKPVMTNYVLATRFEPGTGRLVYEHEARLQRFVQQYHRRGRTPLYIATTRDAAGDDAQMHMGEFKHRLNHAGIDPRRIHVQPGAAPLGSDHSVVLSFRGFDVEVAECGDWTGATGFNPGNLPHTNFSCAYQRNFGLMLSDPGELLTSQDVDPAEPNRIGGVIGGYRAGESPEAELPTID